MNKNIQITFTDKQLEVLSSALVELPYKLAAPLISHINIEIQKQFDLAKGNDPTGQEAPKDNFTGD